MPAETVPPRVRTASPTDIGRGLPALLVLITALIGLPLLLSPFDFWDGRILDHALDTNQIVGVRDWFTTSGWHLQYLIFAAVQTIANATGLSGEALLRLIAIVSLAGVVFETVRFASDIVRMPRFWALASGAAVAAFPAWSTLLSSVLFMYVLCAWLVLAGVRLIHRQQILSIACGVAILVVSLQLNSNFVFSIALAAAYFGSAWVYKGRPTPGDIVRLVAIALTSILCFAALKTVFTPSGIYAEYNRIGISASAGFAVQLVKETLRYLQYPIVLSGVLMTVFCALEVIARIRNRTESTLPTLSARPGFQTHLWPVLMALFLIGAAAFPYIVVGKPADVRLLFDWSQRHTFLMALPVAIFITALARLLCEWPHLRRSKAWFLPIAATIGLMAVGQLAATWNKLSRSAYEAGIVAALQDIPAPGPGLVKIVAPELSGTWVRYYESNWLLYQAYGKEDWHSGIVASAADDIAMPSWLDVDKPIPAAYRSKHIMRTFRMDCRTSLQVAGKPYSPTEVIAWIFGGNLPTKITVTQTETLCSSGNETAASGNRPPQRRLRY